MARLMRVLVLLVAALMVMPSCKGEMFGDSAESDGEDGETKKKKKGKKKKKKKKKGKTKEAKKPGPPPAVSVANYTKSTKPNRFRMFSDSDSLGSDYLEYDEKVTVPLEIAAPEGCEVVVGAHSAKVKDGKAALTIDLIAPIKTILQNATLSDGEMNPTSLGKSENIGNGAKGGDPSLRFPVKVTAPDGGVFETAIHFTFNFVITKYFAMAADGPLLVKGDDPERKGTKTMIRCSIIDANVIGGAKRFVDVDLIAFPKNTYSEKKCGPYVDTSGNREMLDVDLVDTNYYVVDRRTGRKLGTKAFRAKRTCPATMKRGESEYASYDSAVVAKWAEGFLK